MTLSVGFCNPAMTLSRNESISDVPFQLDITAATARKQGLLICLQLNFWMESTLSCCWSGGCFHPLTQHQSQNICWLQLHQTCFQMTKCRKNLYYCEWWAPGLGRKSPKVGDQAIEIIPDLYHDDELRSSWSKLRSRWPHPCIGDSKLRPQPCSFSKFHFDIITVPTSSHSVYLEDTESSTHHHTPISQSPANINNRMFSIAI